MLQHDKITLKVNSIVSHLSRVGLQHCPGDLLLFTFASCQFFSCVQTDEQPVGGRAKRGEIRRHSRQAKTTFIDNMDADCGPVLNTQPAKSLKVNAMYTSSHITAFHAHLSPCNVQSGWIIKQVL